jgi:hypothetical protein
VVEIQEKQDREGSSNQNPSEVASRENRKGRMKVNHRELSIRPWKKLMVDKVGGLALVWSCSKGLSGSPVFRVQARWMTQFSACVARTMGMWLKIAGKCGLAIKGNKPWNHAIQSLNT